MTMNCKNCRRELTQGVDAIGLQAGVIGPRGFVPLEEMAFFCDNECLEGYVFDADGEKKPRRIP